MPSVLTVPEPGSQSVARLATAAAAAAAPPWPARCSAVTRWRAGRPVGAGRDWRGAAGRHGRLGATADDSHRSPPRQINNRRSARESSQTARSQRGAHRRHTGHSAGQLSTDRPDGDVGRQGPREGHARLMNGEYTHRRCIDAQR